MPPAGAARALSLRADATAREAHGDCRRRGDPGAEGGESDGPRRALSSADDGGVDTNGGGDGEEERKGPVHTS